MLKGNKTDWVLGLSIFFLLALSTFVLKAIAPGLFPAHFIYLAISILSFWFFSQVGFEVTSLFSKHFYIVSILLLLTTIVIGQVTRGTVRWIPVGSLSFQPAELARPLLLVFFANYLVRSELIIKTLIKGIALLFLPVVLILVQPSLSVSILTVAGFFGILLASDFNKKYVLFGLLAVLALIPLFWQIMQPYQKQRVMTFLSPEEDPLGAGYNSIQSTISVGSGELTGRGLGKGVQTQLKFLPERQTDFIFASIGEELGFIGAGLTMIATFLILLRLIGYAENSVSPAGRAYLAGFFLTYLLQVAIHTGMNMGILPITGLPLPLVSAGGSSLLATMTGLGIAVSARK